MSKFALATNAGAWLITRYFNSRRAFNKPSICRMIDLIGRSFYQCEQSENLVNQSFFIIHLIFTPPFF